MAQLKDLVAKLRLDTSQFGSGLNQMTSQLNAVGKKMAAIGAGLSVASAGVAAAVRSQINAADDLSKAAQAIGVPIEELSALRHAADMSGVSAEGLDVALGKLARNMVAAADGGKGAGDTFAKLGVKLTGADGKLRSSSEVMADVAEALAQMPDGAAKTAAAMAVFGKSGADLIPMLNGGRAGLQGMIEEANSLGLVIDGKTGKSAEEFNDNLSRLGKTVQGIVIQSMAALAPILEAISAAAVELSKWFRDLSPAMQSVVAGVTALVAVAGPLLTGLGLTIMALTPLAGLFAALVSPIGLVVAAVAAFAAGVSVIYANWDGITGYFAGLWDGVVAKVNQAVSATANAWVGIKEYFDLVLLNIKTAFVDGWNKVVETTTGWVTEFTEIGRNVVEGLKAGIKAKWDDMIAWFEGLADSLAQSVRGVLKVESPSRVFREIGGYITEGLGLGIQDNAGMVTGAMAGISGAIKAEGADVLQQAGSFADSLKQTLTGWIVNGGSLTGALQGMVSSMLGSASSSLAESAVNDIFGMFGFAKGGAFSHGAPLAFARGGVVQGATAFAIGAGRLGVMGEAGPEAIMPLTRGAGGRLGVAARVEQAPIEVVITMDESTGRLGAFVRREAAGVAGAAVDTYDRQVAPLRARQIRRDPRSIG